ncbi:MAG: hypothetical protein AAGA74_12235 [Pseudomonadota bacterium]
MFVLSKVALSLLFICLGAQMALAAERQMTPKQRYEAALAYQSSQPERTVETLRMLSERGYGRASERLAYMTFKGRGTAQSNSAAIVLYEKAINDGRSASLVPLGKAYMEMGEYSLALETWSKASQAGHEKADALRSWAHATRRLGALSEAELGWTDLLSLAQSGSRDGLLLLLDAAVRKNKTPNNVEMVLDQLHARQVDGDAKAAEALLKYYRATRHPNGTVETRSRLIRTTGIRSKVLVEESLYLARDQQPEDFWSASEILVLSAPNDVYARALVVTAKINKNAYVRILQKELRLLGYNVGVESPYMNSPLILSTNKFCRDMEMTNSCIQGPLKFTTIKSVAAQLAKVRTPSQRYERTARYGQ